MPPHDRVSAPLYAMTWALSVLLILITLLCPGTLFAEAFMGLTVLWFVTIAIAACCGRVVIGPDGKLRLR